MPQTKDAWHLNAEHELNKDKFRPKGRQVILYPDFAPVGVKVEGKWGPRELFRVKTNIGMVLITGLELVDINAILDLRGEAHKLEPLLWP